MTLFDTYFIAVAIHNNIPPADLWRRSIVRGHSGVTLRSLPTTR